MKNNCIRIILITVLLTLIAFSLSLVTMAQDTERGTLTISCEDKTIIAGETITLNFNYSEKLSGGSYRLQYDKTKLTWVSTDAVESENMMSVEVTRDTDVVIYEIRDPEKATTAMPSVTFRVNSSVKEGDVLYVGVADTIQLTDASTRSIKPESMSQWSYKIPSTNAKCSGVSITFFKTEQDRNTGINGVTKSIPLSGGVYVINDLVYTHLYYRINAVAESSSASIKYDNQTGTLKTGTSNYTVFTITSESGISEAYTVRMNTLACGHNWNQTSVNTVPQSCEQGGYTITKYTCSICSEARSEKTNETEALGHDYTEETIQPDCENNGYTLHTCSRCGNSYQDNEVKALGHEYVSKGTTTTCSVLGETTYECSKCHQEYSKSDEKLADHNYTSVHTDSTCTELGKTVYTCSVCSNTYTENDTSLASHKEETIVTPPECLKSGWVTTKCTVCGKTLSTTLGDNAKGHSFGEWTIAVAATVESEGIMKRTCTQCDTYETERIPKLSDTDTKTDDDGSGMKILIIILIVGIIILGVLLVVTYITFKKKRGAISKTASDSEAQ